MFGLCRTAITAFNTENVQMSSKQEFSLGNRIKISEKTVTHDNAFFNEYFIK